jgi:hypothetical protein
MGLAGFSIKIILYPHVFILSLAPTSAIPNVNVRRVCLQPALETKPVTWDRGGTIDEDQMHTSVYITHISRKYRSQYQTISYSINFECPAIRDPTPL